MKAHLWKALCLCLISANAVSHPSPRVKQEELHVFRDRAVLFLLYEISEPRFASELRERFDADANRRFSTAETEEIARYLEAQATSDLCLYLDGEPLEADVKLRATHGLDRTLPSAYPITMYWQIDFLFPEESGTRDKLHEAIAAESPTRVCELRFEDSETRWNRPFRCRVRLAPGVEEVDAKSTPSPRNFTWEGGKGSFRMSLLWKSR